MERNHVEAVIGGYTIGGRHFDALIFGYWDGDRLMYAARTRRGFTPSVREQLQQRFRGEDSGEAER
jgi:ATP-dependent DNA ligase